MGLVNLPTNIIDRLVRLERGLEAVKKAAGLASAIIRRGGLSLLDDAFLKMVSSADVQILYIGPDGGGRQVVAIKRDNGSDILYTYAALGGNQYWALTDNGSRVIVSDDAISGEGLARPYLAGFPSGGRYTDWRSTQSATFEPLTKVGMFKHHPRLYVGVRHTTDVDPTTLGEIRVKVDQTGQIVGSVAAVGFTQSSTLFGPVALTGLGHMQYFDVMIEARKTAGGGTGIVRAEPAFVYGVQS
ncbi:MAG TPA: hypothetical protein VM677_08485 [Actinokineospora sp.]|jgi:hypothetical protein|nr:hypothetical protein [Actinokineospora sp.]